MGRDDRAVILRHVAFKEYLRSLRNDPKQAEIAKKQAMSLKPVQVT